MIPGLKQPTRILTLRENQEMTAKTFLNQAARSREFADLLRKL